jgi:hypothetical protein
MRSSGFLILSSGRSVKAASIFRRVPYHSAVDALGTRHTAVGYHLFKFSDADADIASSFVAGQAARRVTE